MVISHLIVRIREIIIPEDIKKRINNAIQLVPVI